MAINTGSHILLISRDNALNEIRRACEELLNDEGNFDSNVPSIHEKLESDGYVIMLNTGMLKDRHTPHLWAYDIDAIPFYHLNVTATRSMCNEREAALTEWREKWDSVALSEGWQILRRDGALVVDFFFDRKTYAKHLKLPLESIGSPQSGWTNFHREGNPAAEAAKKFTLPMKEGLAVMVNYYLNHAEESKQLFNVCAAVKNSPFIQ